MESQKASHRRAIFDIILLLIALLLLGGAWLFRMQIWDLSKELDLTALEKIVQPTDPQKNASGEPTSNQKDAKQKSRSSSSGSTPNGLDLSKISPDGTSVLAGKASPNATVTVSADGEVVGTIKAGEDGDWVLVTQHRFKSLDPTITYREGDAPPLDRVAENAGAKPNAESGKPATSANKDGTKAGKTATAAAVSAALVKDLEKLVETARRDAPKPQPEPSSKPQRKTNLTLQEPTPKQDSARTAKKNDSTPVTSGDDTANDRTPVSPPSSTPETSPPDNGLAEKERVAAFSSPLPTTDTKPELEPEAQPTPSQQPKTKPVPIPIGFAYREASLTTEGRQAIALLSEYLNLKKFTRVVLTGHADERGTRQLNKALSQERLDVVAQHLKDNGFSGQLKLIPKGETQPFADVNRDLFTREELYKLDRRVELLEVR